MFERKRTLQLADENKLPGATISAIAGVDPAKFSLYKNGSKLPSSTETRIEDAVRQIVRVVETFGSVKIDLSNIGFVRLFISKLDHPSCSILTNINPTRFFVEKVRGEVITTDNVLRAGSFSLLVADAICENLRTMADEQMRKTIFVLDNPFGDAPEIVYGVDPRQTEEFQKAMGTV